MQNNNNNNNFTELSNDEAALSQKYLNILLADTYLLYLRTQYYHWNIKGQKFYMLHKMLEEQYLELAEAIDEIAERIVMLGGVASGNMNDYIRNTSIGTKEVLSSDQEMLTALSQDHRTIIKTLRKGAQNLSHTQDEVTKDMIVERIKFHEKALWLIASHI